MLPLSTESSAIRVVRIVENYEVLHFDEVDVLYTGINEFGTRVVGSLVEIEPETGDERHFRIPINAERYVAFRRRQLSYRDILERAGDVYVVTDTSKGELVHLIQFTDIPIEYLPAPNSYSPAPSLDSTPQFTAALSGRLANELAAIAKDVSSVQNLCSRILEVPFDLFDSFVRARAVLKPSAIGSFRLNFDIRVESDLGLFAELSPPETLYGFAEEFLGYCLGGLLYEAETFVDDMTGEQFDLLCTQYDNILLDLGAGIPDGERRQVLLRAVRRASAYLEDVSSSLETSSFDTISLLHHAGNTEYSMGVVNDSYAQRIGEVVEALDRASGERIWEDPEPREYNVIVYDLNKETRRGYARVRTDDGIWWKPRITISGDTSLTRSEFTGSIHSDKEIRVWATARHRGDRIASMIIHEALRGDSL